MGQTIAWSEERLRRSRVLLISAIIWAEVLLAGLHVLITWPSEGTFSRRLVAMVHMDREANLPSWFSSIQLLLLAAALFLVFLLERAKKPERRANWMWLAGAVAACFLSADEAAGIHEMAGTLFGDELQAADDGGLKATLRSFPGYYWALIYIPLAVPVAVVGGKFLWRELGASRRAVIAGMLTFGAGAVGLDFIEGAFGNASHDHMMLGGVSVDVFLLEELMEMFGVTLILMGILEHACTRVLELVPEFEVYRSAAVGASGGQATPRLPSLPEPVREGMASSAGSRLL